jgi:hypothetical protein
MNEHLINLDRLLQFHDWHYEFSDDHRVWQRGVDQWDSIKQEQKRLFDSGLATVEEVQELTQKYAPKG